jgi:hypothetical protein
MRSTSMQPFLITCLRSTLIIFTAFSLQLFADDAGKEKAKEEADLFLVQCESGAKESLYVATVSITSAADSALMLESKGIQKRLQVEGGDLEIVSWNPKVISDDRDDKTSSPVYGTITNEWTRFHHQGREFGLFDRGDGKKEVVHIGAATIQTRWIPQCWALELYDWPFVIGDLFRRDRERRIAMTVFNGKTQCFDGTINSDGTVESCWGKPGRSNFLVYHSFKDGLLTKTEIMFFEEQFSPDIKLPSKKAGITYSLVETKWKRFGDDDVPFKIQATFRDGFQKENALNDLVAEIHCFDKDSKEFKEAFELREKLIEQVTGPKNPK